MEGSCRPVAQLAQGFDFLEAMAYGLNQSLTGRRH
jgi:hypothetical protein